MKDYKKIEFSGEYRDFYWEGVQNFFVRCYAYAARGINILNDFKYFLLFVFGTYWTAEVKTLWGLHIDPMWTLVGGFVGLIIIVLLGRWHLYRAQKPTELVNTYYGSITQFNGYNMQVENIDQQRRIIELLESIDEKIRRINNGKNENTQKRDV